MTQHEPNTVRMNHAAGLAKNGDLVVLCSGWTNVKQPERPKQAAFRDAILRSWVLRSVDGGRTWGSSGVEEEQRWLRWTRFGVRVDDHEEHTKGHGEGGGRLGGMDVRCGAAIA